METSDWAEMLASSVRFGYVAFEESCIFVLRVIAMNLMPGYYIVVF